MVPFGKSEEEIPSVCRGWQPVKPKEGTLEVESNREFGLSCWLNTPLWPGFRYKSVFRVTRHDQSAGRANPRE